MIEESRLGWRLRKVSRARRGMLFLSVAVLAALAGVWLGHGLSTRASVAHGRAAAHGQTPGLRVLRPVALGAPNRIYWGAAIQNAQGQAPWSAAAIATFERLAGKPVSIISWGSQFFSSSDCGGYCAFQTAQFDAVRAHGAIPLFSWGPGWSNGIDRQIAAGVKDAYITQWAQEAKAWGHPFFLRFAWEMNGTWFPWGVGAHGNSAADYVAMWRHVHDIFTRVGATNVTWVWCPNVIAPATYRPLSALYPGNSYVDWTCLDGYNGDNPWTTFSDLYGPSYQLITGTIAPEKPMILGEVASTEAGGSKAAWIAGMFESLWTLFPDVRAIVWLDSFASGPGGHSDWPIESSRAATSAFAAGISSPLFTANDFATLNARPIPPPR